MTEVLKVLIPCSYSKITMYYVDLREVPPRTEKKNNQFAIIVKKEEEERRRIHNCLLSGLAIQNFFHHSFTAQ